MLARILSGTRIAVRSGAAPLVLGLRLAGPRDVEPEEPDGELPELRWSPWLAGKVALDEVFFTSELLLASFANRAERERSAGEIAEARAFYQERGWLDAPARYHVKPPRLDAVEIRERWRPFGPYRELRFESGYEPHAGEPGRERWLGYAANRQAHAWLLEHPGRVRPWVVCIPGYRMGHPLVDFTGFRARWLHRTLGLNVAIPVMPLHGPRRHGPRGGDGFFSGDFVDTIHAQTQAVWDVRRLIGWLREERAPAVAAQGVSLGGYTAALLTCLERRLDCVVVGVPATDFVGLLRSNAPAFLMRGLSRLGLPLEEIEGALQVVSPLAMPPRVARKRLFLFAGLADRLAPPQHARNLWNHWGRPRCSWYQGSHVSFVWEAEVKALILEAFGECGLLSPRIASRLSSS